MVSGRQHGVGDTDDLPKPFCGVGDRNSIRYCKYGFSVVISK